MVVFGFVVFNFDFGELFGLVSARFLNVYFGVRAFGFGILVWWWVTVCGSIVIVVLWCCLVCIWQNWFAFLGLLLTCVPVIIICFADFVVWVVC